MGFYFRVFRLPTGVRMRLSLGVQCQLENRAH